MTRKLEISTRENSTSHTFMRPFTDSYYGSRQLHVRHTPALTSTADGRRLASLKWSPPTTPKIGALQDSGDWSPWPLPPGAPGQEVLGPAVPSWTRRVNFHLHNPHMLLIWVLLSFPFSLFPFSLASSLAFLSKSCHCHTVSCLPIHDMNCAQNNAKHNKKSARLVQVVTVFSSNTQYPHTKFKRTQLQCYSSPVRILQSCANLMHDSFIHTIQFIETTHKVHFSSTHSQLLNFENTLLERSSAHI